MLKRIRKGLDVPIAGVPEQSIENAPPVKTVALVGDDYVGMKPTMEVQEGDRVRRGQLLFTDKKNRGVRYTAPAAGKVIAVNRGEKRVFQSVVIEVDGDDSVSFPSYADRELESLTAEQVRGLLVESGMWPVIRRRPFGKVPSLDETVRSIFVQAIDTNPLAAYPPVIIGTSPVHFRYGLQVIRRLTEGTVYLCTPPGTTIPGSDVEGVTAVQFDGPHPAGLPGTHMHFLAPVSETRPAWYVGYQDVIAIGKLFVTGELPVERIVALGGPPVIKPRLLRTRLGANLSDLCAGQLQPGEHRVISGSVLSGRQGGAGPFDFLGRYHTQVSVVREGREREFLGWQRPGFDKFSVKPLFASALAADGRLFPMTTNRNGSPRAIVPIGAYEKVVPLDIEPTYLLRSLVVGDTEQAQLLGALELEEEDLALCTFVDPGKHEFGPVLRQVLMRIEKEG